jgi:hypothetical protein
MSHPLEIPGARICIIRYPNEVTVCANITGFRALGDWVAWLVASDPTENYHFHLLWHLDSAASRFNGAGPKNVWFLSQAPQAGAQTDFELTFQVISESDLDALAEHQATNTVPLRFQKHDAPVSANGS